MIRTMSKLVAGFVFVLVGTNAFAANIPILNDNSGLLSPTVTIDFGDGTSPSANSVITTQFSAQGVTFGPGFRLSVEAATFPAIAGGYLDEGSVAATTKSIFFTNDVTEAAFSYRVGAVVLFEFLLDGTLIGDFDPFVDSDNSTGSYWGLADSLFDQIRLTSTTTSFTLDNLQFSPVPIPAALPLFAGGLGLLGLLGWRRKRMAAA